VALRNINISKAREVFAVGVKKNEVESVKIRSDNAPTYGLPLWLTFAALTEALGALLEQKADTVALQNTLKHGEALTIVATSDLERAAS